MLEANKCEELGMPIGEKEELRAKDQLNLYFGF
jgi:hypothetical protein